MGTVLFTAIQFLVAAKLDAEDWRVTVPIYIAYSAIAISVGWLSEQLHLFYERAIVGERVTVITQVAIGMRHEVNNALATLLAETQLLETNGRLKSPEDREALRQIGEMARRVHDAVEKLATMTEPPPVKEYALGATMIDLERMRGAPPPAKG
jgi:signal transduction histidine kinase